MAASPNACMTTVELCSAASGLRRANGSTVRLKLTSMIIMITMIIIMINNNNNYTSMTSGNMTPVGNLMSKNDPCLAVSLAKVATGPPPTV